MYAYITQLMFSLFIFFIPDHWNLATLLTEFFENNDVEALKLWMNFSCLE